MNEEQNPLESQQNAVPEDVVNVTATADVTVEEVPSDEAELGGETVAAPPSEATASAVETLELEVSPVPEPSSEEVIAVLQQDLASHRQELAEQSEQLDAFKKRYMSLAAEFDNFRKRTQREKEEQEKVIKGKTISELLSVVDNFERARTQIKPNSEGENDIHKSYQGVYKSLVDSLKRLGVSPMRPEGKPFDPQYHEAMLREPTNDHPEDTVIEELVRGYLLDDLVLRHAMVKVAVPKEDGDDSSSNAPPPEATDS
ncbi:MAG: nucleotide exchange factor GrpE [Synechocystis sp.]|nr:nucleotide exchange factor GrpE [Synechocystis sp.]